MTFGEDRSINANRRQSGYIAVTVCVLTGVIFGFTALAIDVGVLYRNRAQIQQAADAAALAGAFAFVTNPNVLAGPVQTYMKAVGSAQTVAGDPIPSSSVTIASFSSLNKSVGVSVRGPTSTWPNPFAGIFSEDLSSTRIILTATAQVAPNATSATAVRPWFLPNTISGVGTPCSICNSSPTNVLVSGNAVTAFAKTKLSTSALLTLGAPAAPLAANQFYAMQMGLSGIASYTNNIATNSTETISCNMATNGLEGGSIAAATTAGVTSLIGSPADVWVSVAKYQRSDGSFGDTSRALVAIPIWNPCSESGFCVAGAQAGTVATPKVVGFALIFVVGMVGSNVSAHLVNVAACAAPGGIAWDGAAPYGMPVRLVN